ncbi:MAG TPA: SagB/ThcOx family dehydrogenase [Bacteroidota bacterium]|nr:SagB/ThcOx family dehydrogenase [Bacteroidota bacterium]
MKKIIVLIPFLLVTLTVYPQDLKPIQLPPPQKEIGKPFMAALNLRQSTRSFDAKALPLQELSNLLWAADGINRPEAGKRTAPSAMNWQEVDIYVALAEGVYIYDAKANSLTPVAAGDLRSSAGSQAFVAEAPVNLVYVVDMSRVTRGSEEDKTLYTAADVGFIAENVYLYCASQGLAVVVRGSIDRGAISEKFKLRKDQKAILAQTIGYTK